MLATGTSERQLRALTEYIRMDVKETHERLPYAIEGTAESGWILLDYNDVIVHLFNAAQRDYYDLEGLWGQVATTLINIQ